MRQLLTSCLIRGLLNCLQITLVAPEFRSLLFNLFRDLLLDLLRVIELPSRMSNGCLDGHKLWFLRRGNDTPKQLQITGDMLLALSSNAFSAFFILFSAFATAVRALA